MTEAYSGCSIRTGWDSFKIPNAQPGEYGVGIDAGSLHQEDLLILTIVAGADAIAPLDAGTPHVQPGSSTTVTVSWAPIGDP